MNNVRKLKDLRKRLGLSQFRLSKLSKVSRNKISLAECGYDRLTRQEFCQLSEVLLRNGRRLKTLSVEKKELENA